MLSDGSPYPRQQEHCGEQTGTWRVAWHEDTATDSVRSGVCHFDYLATPSGMREKNLYMAAVSFRLFSHSVWQEKESIYGGGAISTNYIATPSGTRMKNLYMAVCHFDYPAAPSGKRENIWRWCHSDYSTTPSGKREKNLYMAVV